MKISEAIVQLEKIKNEVGDLEVINLSDTEMGFLVEYDKTFDVIEVPNADESEFTMVCALIDELEVEPDPDGRALSKKSLKLVK